MAIMTPAYVGYVLCFSYIEVMHLWILCDLLCKYLSRCLIGASLNEIEEEEEAETEADDESKITVPVEGTYKIIGTLKNTENPQPAFVEEIISVCNSLNQNPALWPVLI